MSVLTTILQKSANAVLLFGGNLLSEAQTTFGVEDDGRKLTAEETGELRKVFHDSIDLTRIILKFGKIGAFALGGAPFTHGNTIYIPDGWLPAESSDNYRAEWLRLLVHETVHVWQYQNGGANYMSASLVNQFRGWLETGNRGAAYNFLEGIAAGKTWAQLNPEQQARLIEDAYAHGLFDDENQCFVWNESDCTDYAREAIRQLRVRQGAP